MSFFGFNTSLPPPPGLSAQNGRNELEGDEEELEALDSSYNEEDDALNDETFGMDAAQIGKDFQFTQNAVVKPLPGFSGPPGLGQVMTVDQIETQMRQTQVHEDSPVKKEPLILNVSELEAKMMRQMAPSQSPVPPVIQLSAVRPVVQSSPDRPAEQAAPKEVPPSKYDGLMTEYERNLVARIQLSQLAADETFEDDYYYRLRMARKQNQTDTTKANPQQSDLLSVVLGKQEQVESKEQEENKFQKLLTEAKAHIRPKATQLAIEGALGNIAVYSLRNPKQVLQINPNDQTTNPVTPSQNKMTLKIIEKLYSQVMAIDILYGKWSQSSANPDSVPQETRDQWNHEYTQIVKNMWNNLLSLGRSAIPTSADQPLHEALTPIGMTLLLSYSKGRKLVARILRYLPQTQNIAFLKAIFLALTNCIVAATDPVAVLAEMDDYVNRVVYPFVPLVSETPLTFISECFNLLLQHKQILHIGRTKPGLLFLTLFFSRAEIIKQRSQADAASLKEWNERIAPLAFDSFQTRFAALFPPMHILPPIVTASLTSLPQPILVDDQYVWQFLASLAVGANPDQQRILVSETRDRIFETLRTQGPRGRDKVNIFLNALGLDASQLAPPS